MATPIDPESGFWVHARLGPYHLTRFNVQEVEVAEDVRVDVFADGLAVWSKPGATLARSVEDARNFLAHVAACYTLRTGIALDFTFTGWVEATRASFEGTTIGFTVPRGHRPHMDEKSSGSREMGIAVKLAAATIDRGPWRLAIGDVHSAHLITTDDAFVFAYRAIEDLARARSAKDGKDWASLHALLGTTKTAFMRRTRRLSCARNGVAHGDPNDPAVVWARDRRSLVLGVSRRIVREAIVAEGLPG